MTQSLSFHVLAAQFIEINLILKKKNVMHVDGLVLVFIFKSVKNLIDGRFETQCVKRWSTAKRK